MDSNSQLKKAYRALTNTIVKSVNANAIIDLLLEAEVLTDADYRDLCHVPDGSQKMRSLMALLLTAGHPAAFIELHEAIKKQKPYDWLAKEVDNICTQQNDVTSAAAKPEPKGKFTDICQKQLHCL